MTPKKVLTWIAVCLASAAATVVGLKALNEQLHIRDKVGLSRTVARQP